VKEISERLYLIVVVEAVKEFKKQMTSDIQP